MKKIIQIAIFWLFALALNQTLAQTSNSDSNTVIVTMNDGTTIIGMNVSDDGKDYGVQTMDKGLILIPKYQISSIEKTRNLTNEQGSHIFENPHPSRYLYSPSGITLKKGDGYVQTIFYLVWQAHYALSDHWSIGATTSYIGAPLLFNVKYSTPLKSKIPATQNQWYFASGFQAGGAWMAPNILLGVGFAGFTYGNPESNITVNGGVLGMTDKEGIYHPSTTGNYYDYYYTRSTTATPAVSVSFNTRIAPKTSLMGEFWYVRNTVVGGPALRFYSGKRNTVDFAFLGIVGPDISVIGIPFISWTQRIGSGMNFFSTRNTKSPHN